MREQLLHMLVEAAEIEHNLLCTYLYAAFSLRRPGEGLNESEASAVARWRTLVSGIAVQEMGHLATVNNLIVALGGEPHFDRPNFPVLSGYHPPQFALRLTPLDEATLEHFIFLERPGGAPLEDPADFEHTAPPRETGRNWITPSARDYETIGELYAAIRRGLRMLAAQRGSRTFVAPERQLTSADIGVSGIVVITDLAAALAAVQLVVEQGEGAQADSHDSHFARFNAVKEEWAALKKANPAFAPAHPAVYGLLLILLAQLYEPIGAGERRALAGAAVELMHGLAAVGEALARCDAGLSFAVPRSRGARAGVGLIIERLHELAPHYERTMPGARNAVLAAAGMLEGGHA